MNIVVTGTSRGIGLDLAKHYAQRGALVIGCSRGHAAFEHENYRHYELDVGKEEEVNRFAGKVKKEYKHVDALINNAGAASMNHFMMTPMDTSKRLMDLNFFAAQSCIRAFVSSLRKSKHPRVINFTTVAVPFNLEGEMAYVASKAAVESMTKILAKELAGFHITVNAIGPTPIKTNLIANVPEDKIIELIGRQAIKRFGEFEDVRNVVDFFCDEDSDFITGQIIYLGGVSR